MNPQPTNLHHRKGDTRWGQPGFIIYKSEAPNPQAEFAMQLADRIGLMAAQVDGEDSAGRQRVRLLTPEEVAQRACQIADQTWKEFRVRGWLLDIPVPPDSETKPTDK